MLQTIETNLAQNEISQLKRVKRIVAGDNSKPGNMDADCLHIFNAQKYGRYFITTDNRILKKKSEIKKEFTLFVFSPSDFLEIAMYYYDLNKNLT